ncbi:MAG: two-component regulator propeller domain-containing protein [Bacteroidota bacterium]
MKCCFYTARRLLLLVAICLPALLHAQRYTFHNLGVDDGLVQSQATCMAQDRLGHLWIGTLGGLSRYDGKSFANFTVRNGLLNNTVRAVAADAVGNIWIGTPVGISQYNGKTFTNYTRQEPEKRAINNTQQIQVIGDTAWWRVQGDVYYIAKGRINFYTLPGQGGFASAMLVEKDGMWLAKDGTVYHREGTKWDSLRFAIAADQPQPGVFRIFRDGTGIVWVTTNMGLYRVDNGRLVPQVINGVPSTFLPTLSCITQDRAGALWLGTNSGVIKLSGTVMQVYNKRNGLSDNSFFDMLTDAEGNVWMASDGQGIFRFSGTQFTGLDESMGLPSGQVMALTADKKDSLYLGTYDAGLFIYKDGMITSLSFPSLPVPGITSLVHTKRGKLWIGTRGRGLWSFDNDIFRQYVAPERNFPSNYINSLHEDSKQRLWIGFANGAIMFDLDSFKTVVPQNVPVLSFLEVEEDKVLIATEKGMMVYENGETTPYKTGTIADSSNVKCFMLMGRQLWLGTSDNGVIRYDMDKGKALVINKASGLRSDFIYNIVADNDTNIWVGTGFGIHKIRMTGDEAEITFYGKEQGIAGMESNINAVRKMPDGSIWFGTTKGAYHYQPHTPVATAKATGIILQSVKLVGEGMEPDYYDSVDNWYGIPHNLRLPPKKNSISFTYQAITLSGGQQMLYRYKMEGLDGPWSDWTSNNSVTFSALPSGKYIFRVQCRGAEGQYVKELKYPFEIITPITKTAWFRLVILGACILLGILLQYLVSSRKQRRQKLLTRLRAEEQGKIRLRTAEDFHDEIGNKLTRINVLTSVLKNKITPTPDTIRILAQIEDNTSQLYSGTRDILWSLKPSNDNLYEILNRIRDFGSELFQDTEIAFRFDGIEEGWRKFRLPMDMSRNLLMIFKEALNNALKYAEAKNVWIEVIMKRRNVLQLVIRDDGKGFDMQNGRKGNGISNMTIRAGRMSGRLYVDAHPGKGTIITITFKIPQNR